jgi:hypothetical protein
MFLKNLFFVGILKVNDENSRIQYPDPDPVSGSGTGFISQRHGHQIVMDPQHCLEKTGVWDLFQLDSKSLQKRRLF